MEKGESSVMNRGKAVMGAIRRWLRRQELLLYFRVFRWAYNHLGAKYVKIIIGEQWDAIFDESYAKWKRQYGPEIADAVLAHGGKGGIRVPERRDLAEVRDPR